MKFIAHFNITFICVALLLTFAPHQSQAVVPESIATKSTWGKMVDGAFKAGQESWPYLVATAVAAAIVASAATLGIEHGIRFIKKSKEQNHKN